ncbi:MAG: tRNA-dihydrouridine synthase [Candidatus Magasanikbacteria bacterium]|nr:tRNA-dihydrouridine synthase [Candidatus Magasanikbacteria bacterium]
MIQNLCFMKKDFYKNLNKGALALAPMAGVADSAFRQMCKKFGADVLYSEMASVTALFYAPEKTLELVEFAELERPYVVQLFGCDPEHFAHATRIITEKVKPDGIDINFGCPVPKVRKQGAGAVLMADMKKAREVIKATIDNTDLPVSIKTRTKSGEVEILNFLEYINDLDIKALMIHGRTLNQGFAGEIDMAVIKKARDYFGGFIFANGGINSVADAEIVMRETEADGLALARGALGRPWLFEEIKNKQEKIIDKNFIIEIALEHARLAEKLKGQTGIVELRKHLCAYVGGLPGARELRGKMVGVNSVGDIEKIFNL